VRPSLPQFCCLRSRNSAGKLPSTKYGTTLEQALSIERERADLVEIASAENENITVHSQCLDLVDLIESEGLLRDLRGRQGFEYDIRCTDMEFVVTATPPREAYGAKLHNPVITVNQELQVREDRQRFLRLGQARNHASPMGLSKFARATSILLQ
jgi:hypothetical protein